MRWRVPGAIAAFSSSILVGGLLWVRSGEWGGGGAIVFLGLTLPLTGFGYLYDLLVRHRLLIPGSHSLVLYWGLAFPVARLIHLVMVQGGLGLLGSTALPTLGFAESGGVGSFMLWQGVFGLMYGVGFLLFYHQVCGFLMGRVAR